MRKQRYAPYADSLLKAIFKKSIFYIKYQTSFNCVGDKREVIYSAAATNRKRLRVRIGLWYRGSVDLRCPVEIGYNRRRAPMFCPTLNCAVWYRNAEFRARSSYKTLFRTWEVPTIKLPRYLRIGNRSLPLDRKLLNPNLLYANNMRVPNRVDILACDCYVILSHFKNNNRIFECLFAV